MEPEEVEVSLRVKNEWMVLRFTVSPNTDAMLDGMGDCNVIIEESVPVGLIC